MSGFRLGFQGGAREPIEIGAVYTVGMNYRDPASPDAARPERPLIYGKASSSLIGDGATIGWDCSLTQNVDGECELGVVIGPNATVLGYTIVNDVTSQDAWLDGDQWLLGKSMRGFCPAGPWIVPADELDPSDLGVCLTINGVCIQDGRTSQMRFSVPAIVAFLGAHVALRPGDLIATGTPKRIGPDAGRHLQPGDRVTCTIESIGTLTTTVA
jgi:2-keto-4-pentenoate hydratase/2-oxohepta-3-ene-1,7-dioic acid hydratase in catechol pathway